MDKVTKLINRIRPQEKKPDRPFIADITIQDRDGGGYILTAELKNSMDAEPLERITEKHNSLKAAYQSADSIGARAIVYFCCIPQSEQRRHAAAIRGMSTIVGKAE